MAATAAADTAPVVPDILPIPAVGSGTKDDRCCDARPNPRPSPCSPGADRLEPHHGHNCPLPPRLAHTWAATSPGQGDGAGFGSEPHPWLEMGARDTKSGIWSVPRPVCPQTSPHPLSPSPPPPRGDRTLESLSRRPDDLHPKKGGVAPLRACNSRRHCPSAARGSLGQGPAQEGVS